MSAAKCCEHCGAQLRRVAKELQAMEDRLARSEDAVRTNNRILEMQAAGVPVYGIDKHGKGIPRDAIKPMSDAQVDAIAKAAGL